MTEADEEAVIKNLFNERNNILKNIQLLNKNDPDIVLLRKRYFCISNKITYIRKREQILDKKYFSNREYIYRNYDKILENNREYQRRINGYYE